MSTFLLTSQPEGSLAMSIGIYCAASDKYSETYVSLLPASHLDPIRTYDDAARCTQPNLVFP